MKRYFVEELYFQDKGTPVNALFYPENTKLFTPGLSLSSRAYLYEE
jgi:hypothetical protein